MKKDFRRRKERIPASEGKSQEGKCKADLKDEAEVEVGKGTMVCDPGFIVRLMGSGVT